MNVYLATPESSSESQGMPLLLWGLKLEVQFSWLNK